MDTLLNILGIAFGIAIVYEIAYPYERKRTPTYCPNPHKGNK